MTNKKRIIYKYSLKKYDKYEYNPFIKGLVIKKKDKTIAIAEKALINLNTGDPEKVAFIYLKKELDKEEFMKFFLSELNTIFDLSSYALKVLIYISNAIKINEDKIYFSVKECTEQTKLSKVAVYYGLYELLENKLIARSTDPRIFFINPKIMFKGDRLVIIRDYFRKMEEGLKNILKIPSPELPLDNNTDNNNQNTTNNN